MSALAVQGIVLVLLTTLMEGLAQVMLKLATGPRKIRWTILALLVFAAEAVVYTVALDSLDISIAYPLGALGFVVVTLLSRWWLKEAVDRTRWYGLLLIILGAALVASRA